jgi:endonuclease-3 related protein
MHQAYGAQHWWPADSSFEVMVGAILTQNTAWGNVEKAIVNLKHDDLLTPERLALTEAETVAKAIRPAGYFNVKTRRLQAFCTYLLERGGEAVLAGLETQQLRKELLAVHGVGPETADDILLYAFARPVFVIDSYTRRIFMRLGAIEGKVAYDALRLGFERELGADSALYGEYHGLIVQHAKQACRVRPVCGDCCLRQLCKYEDAQ